MSDYARTTNFTAKDSLPTGNASKVVKGSEIDAELDNVATAIATKIESGDTVAALTITSATLTAAAITTLTGTVDGGTY